MQRVSVVGNSGSGKTTLARALSTRLAAPHLELDSVFHQPGWEPLPTEQFRARVAEFIAADRWVIDGNYSKVQDLIWQRADTVVWVDLPRRLVMWRVIWRSVRRAALRAELWNGNRERWGNLLHIDPAKSVIAWSWTRHRRYRERYLRAAADPARQQLTFIRLRTPAEAARLLSHAGRRPGGEGVGRSPGGEGAGRSPGREAVDSRHLVRVEREAEDVEVGGDPPGIG